METDGNCVILDTSVQVLPRLMLAIIFTRNAETPFYYYFKDLWEKISSLINTDISMCVDRNDVRDYEKDTYNYRRHNKRQRRN